MRWRQLRRWVPSSAGLLSSPKLHSAGLCGFLTRSPIRQMGVSPELEAGQRAEVPVGALLACTADRPALQAAIQAADADGSERRAVDTCLHVGVPPATCAASGLPPARAHLLPFPRCHPRPDRWHLVGGRAGAGG